MKFKATYDGNHDTFRLEFLLVPVGGLAFLVNHDFSPLEVRLNSRTSLNSLFFFMWTALTCLSSLLANVAELQILWTFSIYLESVAILPQLFMISKTGEAETITTHYLFFLGLYRALYLFNWIWRFYFEGFFDMIAIVAGIVQTILYCDFFYLYITKGEFWKVNCAWKVFNQIKWWDCQKDTFTWPFLFFMINKHTNHRVANTVYF